MQRRIRASSNQESLYVILPKYITEMMDLKANQEIEIVVRGTKIIIETKVKEE